MTRWPSGAHGVLGSHARNSHPRRPRSDSLRRRRRRADVVFLGSQTAVFVDGCFWHGCPEHRALPRANESWWRAKINRNRERDAETDARLRDAGWAVIRVWEHEDPA